MTGLRPVVLVLCVLTPLGALALQTPSDLTVEATSASGAIVSFTATGSGFGDDENGRPTTIATCAPASGSTFPLGTTIVNCTSGEESGSFAITIVDTTAPVLTLPAGVNAQGNSSGAIVTWTASAIDAVDGSRAVDCAPASGSQFAVGTHAVQCTTSDTRNNTASGSFSVNVTGPSNPPPPPVLPGDITKEATGPDGAVVVYSVTGGDEDEDGRPIEESTCTPASGSRFALGSHNVQCASGSFKVHVVDTTGPSLNLPRDFTVPTSASNGTNVTFDASAHDLVDGSVSITCSPASGDFFPIGSTGVNCTSSDSRNNTSERGFIVSVVTQPPSGPPSDITAEATGPNGAVVSFSFPGYGDDENGRPARTANCAPASGSTFPLGETTVQCDIGNFKVTIVDTTAPMLALPDNITSQSDIVTFTASATDLVDGSVGVTCAPPSGSTFANGATSVVCTASDTRNNTATGSFTVTVDPTPPPVDTEAPVIVLLSATPDVLQPPNGKLVDVELSATVTDNLDASPYVGIYDVTASEAIELDDWVVTSPLTLQLRAKRNGADTGRVYTVHVEAIDNAGNRSTRTVTVTVPHDNGNAQPVDAPPATGKRRAAGRG
jgi:HYR domain-containing protein